MFHCPLSRRMTYAWSNDNEGRMDVDEEEQIIKAPELKYCHSAQLDNTQVQAQAETLYNIKSEIDDNIAGVAEVVSHNTPVSPSSVHSSECTNDTLDILGTSEYFDAVRKQICDGKWQLDHKDRTSIHEDIHGVSCCPTQEDSPALVSASLANLSFELCEQVRIGRNIADVVSALATGQVPSRQLLESSLAAGYIISQWDYNPANLNSTAASTNSTLVNSVEFRLRFLKCEKFDAKKAAVRMMKYLNLAFDLFGSFALWRTIELSDFTSQEIKILQSGWLQVLPFRDRSGRKVFVWIGKLGFELDPILRIKMELYFLLAGTCDPESQRKGIVTVVWPLPSSSSQSWIQGISSQRTDKYNDYFKKLIDAVPVATCAVHYCILPGSQNVLSPLFEAMCKMILAVGNSTSLTNRTLLHFGSAQEIRNILSGYGIPVNLIPITNSYSIKSTQVRHWVKNRMLIEDEPAAADAFIDCPQSNDVVFRSGSTMIHNPGNVVFRGLIEVKIKDYYADNAAFRSPKTKDKIASEIVQEVMVQRKGRFLSWDTKNDCWKKMEDITVIKNKVAIAYRDLKLKLLKL